MNLSNTIQDLKEQCKVHMAEQGLELSGSLITDGKIHRYSADSKQNKRDEWYIAYEGMSLKGNCCLTCIYGSWSDGSKHKYSSYEDEQDDIDSDEYKEISEAAKRKQQEAEEQLKKEHDAAAIRATQIWQDSVTTPSSDEYLTYVKAKGIEPLGVRFGMNPNGYPSMIVPLYNNKHELSSLQYISRSVDGRTYKTFLSGGETSGNYFILGMITTESTLFVVEGYATGVTIFQAIKLPVVVAFSSHFLRKVVGHIQSAFPHSTIIVAADNDVTGMEKAEQVAQEFGCQVITPTFPEEKRQTDDGTACTDFNDLQHVCGLEEVKKQLAAIQPKATKTKTPISIEKKDPCRSFSVHVLPPILKKYVTTLAETTEAHPIMITLSVLATLSGFIGKLVFVDGYHGDKRIYCNLWILIIARSGQFKTTALNLGSRLAYQRRGEVVQKLDNLKQRGKEGYSEEEYLEISRRDIILPNKGSIEGLILHLSEGHNGVIISNEFGGILKNADKKHNSDYKQILTELYDVPFTDRYKTKTQGDLSLSEPFISICGVSTLTWIKSFLSPSDVESGFFARFLIYTPPYKKKVSEAFPAHRKSINLDIEREVNTMINSLDTRSYKLSDEGRNELNRMAKIIDSMIEDLETKEELLSLYIDRWTTYLLKIAMILQLFDDPSSNEITVTNIIRALSIVQPAIQSTTALFEGELSESAYQRKCRKVYEWIYKRVFQHKKRAKRKDILSSRQLNGGSKEYDSVLTTLIESGKLNFISNELKNESEYLSVVEED